MLWPIAVVILIICLLIKLVDIVYYWQMKGVQNIKPFTFWRDIIKNIRNKISFVDGLQIIYKYYPNAKFIGIFQFTKPVLMIKDPDMIKKVCVKNFDHFVDHTIVLRDDIDPLLGKNLVSLKGQRWKEMRSILSPAFTSSKMRSMFTLISECSQQFTEYFVKEAEKEKGKCTLEMKDIFTRYTNDVIATCAFGIKCDSLKDKTNEFYTTGKEITGNNNIRAALKIIPFLIMPKIMKALKFSFLSKRIQNFFFDIIKNTMSLREKNHIIRPDMIHLLMEARKGQLKHDTSKTQIEEDAGFSVVEESNLNKEEIKDKSHLLTDVDITAQALLFFLAGYETSSVFCTCVF